MKNHIIEATKYTPRIELNNINNTIQILGKSTPENTTQFYKPVLEWLENYFQTSKTVDITFNIPYFNSSSSRVLYDIFDIFENAFKNGSSLTIVWEYDKENENGKETGEEFVEDFENLHIELKEK